MRVGLTVHLIVCFYMSSFWLCCVLAAVSPCLFVLVCLCVLVCVCVCVSVCGGVCVGG